MFKKLTHFLFVVLVSGLMTTVAGAHISDGLVAYWPLDEGQGTTTADDSGNGSDGTFIDAPVWVSGKFGGALEFDGTDDAVDCGNPTILDFGTGDWTISAWIKVSVNPGDDMGIFSKGMETSPNTDYQIRLRDNDGGDIMIRIDHDDTRYNATTGDEHAENLIDGQWHHIVGMRRDSTMLRVYVDGVEDTAVTNAGGATIPADFDLSDTSAHNAYIGAIAGGAGNPRRCFLGLIDDVAVWNRALTADEVTYLWNDGEGNTISPNVTIAHDPQPENRATGVDVPSVTLNWKTGLDPNDPNVPNPNIVEHYLWVSIGFDSVDVIPANPWDETLYPGTQKFTILADGDGNGNVDVTASQVIGGLEMDKVYVWVVDEGLTGSSGPLETDPAKIKWGNWWRFETVSSGPVADANSIVTWLKDDGTTTVALNGIVTDPTGDISVIEWSVLTTPFGATVNIANPAAAATTATFTETGTYVLRLYARDADMQEDETAIEVLVYNNSCEAAKSIQGYTAPAFDFNGDCKEDFLDLALFAAKWLEDERLPADLRYDAGDITLPVVQFTFPQNGGVVSGSMTINVISYDPGVGIEDGNGMEGDGGIHFDILDGSGAILDSHDEGSAAWNWTLDSTLVPNGVYTVRVTATSDAGYAMIEEISVTVSN